MNLFGIIIAAVWAVFCCVGVPYLLYRARVRRDQMEALERYDAFIRGIEDPVLGKVYRMRSE